MNETTIQIKEVERIPYRVDITWPKPDTRIPEAQRPPPVITGHVDCEFVYFSVEEQKEMDEQIDNGDITIFDKVERMVPVIKGLPLENGETAHQFLDRFRYGGAIRSAILDDYNKYVAEGRRGNSKKRR